MIYTLDHTGQCSFFDTKVILQKYTFIRNDPKIDHSIKLKKKNKKLISPFNEVK